MRSLFGLIERYKDLKEIGWQNKMFYSMENDHRLYYHKNIDWFKSCSDEKLKSYYPHLYYPEKTIVYFVLVREFPGFDKQIKYIVQKDDSRGDFITGKRLEMKIRVSDCLDFPEFFKPIYS